MLYFAYGSNMNLKQMKIRCPDARFIRRAYLEGFKFVYDGFSQFRGGAVANIAKDRESTVWGALFEITELCLDALDKFEGYPYVYDRKVLIVKDDEGNEYQAWVYLREPREEGKPSKHYFQIVLEGARKCKLPEKYVKKFIEIY